MAAPYKHIVFVCTNDRGAGNRKQSCAQSEGPAVVDRFKDWIRAHDMRQQVRVTRAGCLGLCSQGCVVAVFSIDAAMPQTWYTRVTAADADALLSSHVLANTPYARLVAQTKE